MVTEITPADGRSFADRNLPDAEALRAKADLVIALARILRERRLSQTKAAAIVGLTQPDLSRLLRGKLEGFSIERLIRVLAALGYEVRVEVHPADRLKAAGQETLAEAAA